VNNQINYTRVRRIKKAIYAFIVLLFLVPATLLIILGVQTIGFFFNQNQMAQTVSPDLVSTSDPASAPQNTGQEQSDPELPFPVPPSINGDGEQDEPAGGSDQLIDYDDQESELLGQIAAFPRPQQQIVSGEGVNTPPEETQGQDSATQPQGDDVPIPFTGIPRDSE